MYVSVPGSRADPNEWRRSLRAMRGNPSSGRIERSSPPVDSTASRNAYECINAVTHGFRSSFKVWARQHDVDELLSEFALAHIEGSATVAACARDDLYREGTPGHAGVGRLHLRVEAVSRPDTGRCSTRVRGSPARADAPRLAVEGERRAAFDIEHHHPQSGQVSTSAWTSALARRGRTRPRSPRRGAWPGTRRRGRGRRRSRQRGAVGPFEQRPALVLGEAGDGEVARRAACASPPRGFDARGPNPTESHCEDTWQG